MGAFSAMNDTTLDDLIAKGLIEITLSNGFKQHYNLSLNGEIIAKELEQEYLYQDNNLTDDDEKSLEQFFNLIDMIAGDVNECEDERSKG
ncbi:unnamed protein product [marine sediment metagenome]|uniref:Uncharacterized protein n=1 Tax=marine sediment metagenome TaxID=412755 RepID=X1C5J8_9ZZZZ